MFLCISVTLLAIRTKQRFTAVLFNGASLYRHHIRVLTTDTLEAD